VFCIYLRTDSNFCPVKHELIGFYNGDEKCLQRGTDWVFKWSGLRFVFKVLKCKLIWKELFGYTPIITVLKFTFLTFYRKALSWYFHTERCEFLLRTLSGVWWFGLCCEKNSRRFSILCCGFATTLNTRAYTAG
jgi:hypothetical protein